MCKQQSHTHTHARTRTHARHETSPELTSTEYTMGTEMQSVKINRQSLYQPRRYTNNLPITLSRGIERFFRARRVSAGGRDSEGNSSATSSRSSSTSTSFFENSRREEEREKQRAPFTRGTYVLDNELHKPRLESKLKLSASLLRNFQQLSQYNAPSVPRLCIFKERH